MKMKKIFAGIVITFLVLVIAVGIIFTRKLQYYPPLTMNAVANDAKRMAIYGLEDQTTPEDFGFTNYENVTYYTSHDMKLKGWYITAPKKTLKCYCLYHGRSANRMKGLAYLRLIKDLNLDKTFNIFIPDLRNSGESSEAVTTLGYYVADDIYNSLHYLKEEKGNNRFILHGFSMGALGITIALKRYEQELKNMDISHVILDSPVSNARKVMRYEVMQRMGLPGIVAFIGITALDTKLGFSLDSMKLSETLKDTDIHTLIMSARDDDKVPNEFLEPETSELSGSVVKVLHFDSGNHSRLYLQEKGKYTRSVGSFIKK